MKKNRKDIILTVILAALIVAPGFTPYGLIPLGLVNITILHIPVIIAAMTEKRGVSLFYGLLFGLMSTLAAFGLSFAPQSGAMKLLLPYSALSVITICIIPRMLIPIVTATVFDKLKSSARRSSVKLGRIAGVSALIGSVTNTVAYLAFVLLFYSFYGMSGRFSSLLTPALGIGILCEALAAALISDAVVSAVYRSRKDREEDLSDAPAVIIPDEDAVPTDDGSDISSVDEVSVAVIPSMDSLLPKLDENMQRKHDRCMKYLDDDNAFMADCAFDSWLAGFSDDDDLWGASVYVLMRFLDMSKHKTAADRLVRFLRKSITPAMITDEHKRVYLGIMNIIHTSASLDAGNPVEAALLEPLFTEAGDLIKTEKFAEAADKLEKYMTEIGAKDRVIRRTEEYVPKYEDTAAAQASVRELTEDDSSEGVSEINVAVIPTAAGIELSPDADFTTALRLLSVGADAKAAFETALGAISDEKDRAAADAFIMLTYFERNDYVHALSAVISALQRGYSDDILSESGIKKAAHGIFTIAHSSLRVHAGDKAAQADRTIEKAGDFLDKGMGVLCAQLLEKYFLITGLAKNS